MQDLKIAAIQMTSAMGDIEGNLTSIDRLHGDTVRQGADIACFPELCVSGYNTSERNGDSANVSRISTAVEAPSDSTDALEVIGNRYEI